jgi:hypothetical protein
VGSGDRYPDQFKDLISASDVIVAVSWRWNEGGRRHELDETRNLISSLGTAM